MSEFVDFLANKTTPKADQSNIEEGQGDWETDSDVSMDSNSEQSPFSIAYDAPGEKADIRESKISAAYICALTPPKHSEGSSMCNAWCFAFRIQDNESRTVQVHLNALPSKDPFTDTKDTFIKAQFASPVGINGRVDGMAKTLKIAFKRGATVGDFLDEVEDRKLTKYQLVNGKGRRAWVDRILKETTSFFCARDEANTARTYLYQGWVNEFPICPGDYIEIRKGNWLDEPWKITID